MTRRELELVLARIERLARSGTRTAETLDEIARTAAAATGPRRSAVERLRLVRVMSHCVTYTELHEHLADFGEASARGDLPEARQRLAEARAVADLMRIGCHGIGAAHLPTPESFDRLAEALSASS